MLSKEMVQLIALRDLFKRTGALHEVQRLNLRLWSDLACPHLKFQTAEVIPSMYRVCVDYSETEAQPPDNLKERQQSMVDAVQMMLGPEYALVLKANGKTIFEGEAKSEPAPVQEYTGVDFDAGKIEPSEPWVFKKDKPTK